MKMSYSKEDLKRLCRDHGMDDCSRGAVEFYSSDIIEVEEVRQKCK